MDGLSEFQKGIDGGLGIDGRGVFIGGKAMAAARAEFVLQTDF
jgi:hypothetical protein